MLTWDKFNTVKKQLPKGSTIDDAIAAGYFTTEEFLQLMKSQPVIKQQDEDHNESTFFLFGAIIGSMF